MKRGGAGYWPTRPSMRSRRKSAWPLCRRVFLDHVDDDLTQCDRAFAVVTGDPQVRGAGHEVLGERDLGPPGGPGPGHHGRVGNRVVEVRIGPLPGAVQAGRVLAGQGPAEPAPLGFGQVTDQAKQRQVGRRDRPAGHRRLVQARAFQLQREPPVAEISGQDGALVTAGRCAGPGVVSGATNMSHQPNFRPGWRAGGAGSPSVSIARASATEAVFTTYFRFGRVSARPGGSGPRWAQGRWSGS